MELNGNRPVENLPPLDKLGVGNSQPHDSWLMAKQYFMWQCTLPPAHCSKNPTEPTLSPKPAVVSVPTQRATILCFPPKESLVWSFVILCDFIYLIIP